MYAILRFEKRKSGTLGGIQAHHEREKESYRSNPDIDPAKAGQNYHIKQPAHTYRKEVSERITAAGCRVRKDSVLLVDTFIGGTHEFVAALSPVEQEAYFRHAYAFLQDRVGGRNIVSAAVHMDEKTPHMHLCFVPITEDGRLSAKDVLGHRDSMVRWQDDFHTHMKARWPQLLRGESAAKTGRKHIPVRLYKEGEKLDRETDKLRKVIGDIGRLNAPQKRQEAIALLERWYPRAVGFEAKVRRIAQHNEQLEGRLQAVTTEAADMADKLADKSLETAALRARCEANQRLIQSLPPDILRQLEATRKQNKQRKGPTIL